MFAEAKIFRLCSYRRPNRFSPWTSIHLWSATNR